MDKTYRTSHDWSTLPDHLLAVITKRLQSIDDILRFRAVCNSFRSSASSPLKSLIPDSALRTSFPMGSTHSRRNHFLLFPTAPTRTTRNRSNHFLLTESTVYVIEPLEKISNTNETTQTWIVKVEELNSGEVRIKDPLCGFRFKSLSNELPKSLNLLDYQIKEISKAYRLELSTVGKGRSRVYRKEMYKKKPTFFVKVVGSTGVDDQFAVMAIHRSGKLVVWKNGDKKFTNIELDDHDDFEDIIYHNKRFYALGYSGVTITVDSTSFTFTHITDMKDRTNGVSRHYLVKSFEDLLLVYRYWAHEDRRLYFKVFKLDEEKKEWVQVMDGLEDRVLFVGEDCSFSVSAKEFPGCKGHCIYFTHNSFSKGNDDHPGMSAGIFCLKDNTVGRLSAFPEYSKIFWPPPTWLKHHDSTAHDPFSPPTPPPLASD